MVLDPFSALSLAGNIVQFVDFSTKFLSRIHGFYQDRSGILSFYDEFDLVATDLRHNCDLIPETSAMSTSNSHTALRELWTACHKVADEYLLRLHRLKAIKDRESTGVRKSLQSFHIALMSIWTEDEIQSLIIRLSSLREQIQLHVLLDFKNQFNLHHVMSLEQSKHLEGVESTMNGLLTSIIAIRTDVARDITETQKLLRDQSLRISKLSSEFCLALENKTKRQGSKDRSSAVTDDVSYLASWTQGIDTRARLQVATKILDDLRFPTIAAREEQIQDAYPATYRWIFHDAQESARPWSSFVDWLKTGSGVYWVKGKAASGKSTLMRYVSHHHQTKTLLEDWGGERDLHIIRFYFWASGTAEQRSQAGLLRSLLSECFIQDPNLIPIVLPALWTKYYSEMIFNSSAGDVHWENESAWKDLQKTGQRWPGDWDSWTLESLMNVFTLLLEQDTIPTKLCIFVDGLDEYDGNHATIAALFQRVATSPHVKVCASSRPLLQFEDAFKTEPMLRLQDLTENDIKLYITSNLNANMHFQRFALEEPNRAQSIIQDVLSKADGVFLWVVLVVRSLIEGLGNRDDISYLQRRIDELPLDLENLFASMLAKVPALYRANTSELFQTFRCAREYENSTSIPERLPVTLDLLTLALGVETESELLGVSKDFKTLPATAIPRICRNMEDRLKVRTMGLLEVPKLGCPEDHREREACGAVNYIHRTVCDYLESPQVKSFLLQETDGSDFSPNITLLRAYVRRIQAYKPASEQNPYRYFTAAMVHAQVVDLKVSKTSNQLIHALGVAGDLAFPKTASKRGFLCLAAQYGLCSYMNETLRQNIKIPRLLGEPPLLYEVLTQENWTGPLLPSVQIVAILLKWGADPNEKWGRRTVWVELLVEVNNHSQAKGLGVRNFTSWLVAYADIFKLLLEQGADAKAVCRTAGDTKTARRIVMDTFRRDIPERAASLDAIFKARGGKLKVSRFTRQ